jgi:hypothetical protein
MNGPSRPQNGRMLHYSEFYGLADLPAGGFGVVAGNCQAESLRIMLDGGDLPWVRIPAVHEFTAADMPHLARVLAAAAVLVSQPIRDDYRGLPTGTRNLVEALGPGAQAVLVPVVRFAGLYPTHAIIRPPSDTSLTPPIVEYHDLRVLADAAGRLYDTPSRRPAPASPGGHAVRAVGAQSLRELRSREQQHDTVVISDLFERPTFEHMRTINHPGNLVWHELAARVRSRLGHAPHSVDPGRELLDSVHAPRRADVAAAYSLDSAATAYWRVGGRDVAEQEVREAHLAWYASHPDAVDAGLVRHAEAMRHLGLTA